MEFLRATLISFGFWINIRAFQHQVSSQRRRDRRGRFFFRSNPAFGGTIGSKTRPPSGLNHDGFEVERISDPERIREALSRYVAVEQTGWKGKEGIGVGKDKRAFLFYENLLVRLAGKGKASIYFLKSKGETIAGKICFIQQDIVYSRETTYLPSFAAYSPGILLGAEIIQDLFRGAYRELDLLGSSRFEAPPKHKIDWATGQRETVHFTACRVYSRPLSYVVFKCLEHILKRDGWRNQEQSDGSLLRLRKGIRASFGLHFFR